MPFTPEHDIHIQAVRWSFGIGKGPSTMNLKVGISVVCAMACAAGMAFGSDTSAVAASDANLPFYTAFKTFCVDTGAVPEKMNQAVRSAGGKPHNPPGCSTENGTCADAPFPLTLAGWDVVIGGHRFLVNTGRSWPSRKFHKGTDMDDCDISGWQNEDPSITAIQKWIGIPPSDVSLPSPKSEYSPHLTIYFYGHQVVGTAHMAMTDTESVHKATAEGRSWGLVLMREPKGASLQFVHYLPGSGTTPAAPK